MIINQSTNLKIWTLLTQACIIIGAGHGVFPLMLLEVAGALRPFEQTFPVDKLAQAIFLYSITAFGGQTLLIASIFCKKLRLRRNQQIAGTLLLSLGTWYIIIVAYFDPFTIVVYLTCLPFGGCILLVFFGRYIDLLTQRLG